ncbi:MAG: glycosyltransferase [Candidatus Kariarchaeaceae archaeon]
MKRPEYPLYSPVIKGNLTKHYIIKSVILLLLLCYIIYTLSLGILFLELTPLNMFFNLVLLFSELLLGYYSLFLLLHIANAYKPVNHPLEPKISQKDINTGNLPIISILVPLYREPLKIVKQTLLAALDLNYPKDKYDITLIEDGRTDESIQHLCEELNVKYLFRKERKHFKAGAVNYALPKLIGDYVFFIDADHILEKNVFYNCLLSWRKDTIAVQSRIDFVNTTNMLTLVGAYLQVQFFSLFQRARRATGSAVFAGGAALFDRHLLIQEGGLNPLTIADDTDTSYILRSRNYRIEFIDTIGAWALIPWDPLHLIRQIWRWLTGITRSFRARAKTIFKSDSPKYVKVDHISSAILPTMTLVLWLSVFLRGFIIIQGYPVLKIEWLFGWTFLGLIPLVVPLFSIITGFLALLIDNKNISYKSNPIFTQITGVSGFYILMFAAQPFLIGAIVKGLFSFNVSFNRTPKEKKVKDAGLGRIMKQYFLLSIFLFIMAGFWTYNLLSFRVDLGNLILSFLYMSMIFPLLISFLWYWSLESYLETVEGISALNFIQD